MPSAMPRLLIILSAGLAISLVGPVSFAQPATKSVKKTTTQKPAVVSHTVSTTTSKLATTSHPITSHTAVKSLHFSMGPAQTFTLMDAWAYAYKAGNGNVVRQSMAPNSPVIERLAHGTQFHVIGRGTDRAGRVFYEVQTPDSRTGWMEPGSVRF